MDKTIFSLIQKYDVPGPRYTSYPTTPHWKEKIQEIDFKKAIEEAPGKSIAIYTHIPFCEEKCFYCACNVVITKHKDKADEYIDMLKKEMALLHVPDLSVTQIHWGGGTPTYLNLSQIESLFTEYKKYFSISDSAEISIEIDPRVTTLEQLKLLHQLGFNRVSLGVQDMNPQVQSAIHRNQTEVQTKTVFEWCRELGFKSINLDFVYGLPFQTEMSFKDSLDMIIDLSPDRLAFYNYAHVPWMVPWQKRISTDSLPKPELKFLFLSQIFQKFEEAGYIPIGMDHFAKKEDELVCAVENHTLRRNFMGYTTQKDALLFAFGLSAIGDYYTLYIQNFKKLPDYYRAIQNQTLPWMRGYHLSETDLMRRYVIMELLCHLIVKNEAFKQKFGFHLSDVFSRELGQLSEMVSEGLVEIDENGILITKLGRLFIRNIGMVFDEYLKSCSPRYSRTV